VLPCVAVCCSMSLQRVCSAPVVTSKDICVGMCCSVLQYVVLCCSVLQGAATYAGSHRYVHVCIAVCCSVLQCVAVRCNFLTIIDANHVSVYLYYSVLQCVALCCTVLHAAVCGSVL